MINSIKCRAPILALVLFVVAAGQVLPAAGQAPPKVVVIPMAGAVGITDFEWVTASTSYDSTNSKDIYANCPTGLVAIGGGARVAGASSGVALSTSGPEGVPPTSWYGKAQEMVPTSNSWTLRVDVHCARISE